MHIIICGAGELGRHAAEVLGANGDGITVIDKNPAALAALDETLDVRTMVGNGTQADVLAEAGCANAHFFLVATDMDEINLLSASVAKGVGARKCIARVHHIAFFDQHGLNYSKHLGIDHLVCPEFSTALAIAQTLRSPGALAVERFARGRIEMQAFPVSQNASSVGKMLAQIHLPGSARLAAIERGGSAFIPDYQSGVEAGDVVTLVGDAKHFDKARKLFAPDLDRRRRVMIMGGSSLSVWLCRALRGKRFSVRLFESNPSRAEELANKLEWVTVMTADPTESDILREEHIDQVDAFVAATGEDELNIITAAQAKSSGAQSAVAVLKRGTYLHLLEHVGIDQAFCPQIAAVQELQHLMDDSPVRRLASLSEGVADVFEVRVPAVASEVIGRPLKQVALPSKALVAAIQRGDDVRVPGATDTIVAGDLVVLIAPAGAEKLIKQTFAIK